MSPETLPRSRRTAGPPYVGQGVRICAAPAAAPARPGLSRRRDRSPAGARHRQELPWPFAAHLAAARTGRPRARRGRAFRARRSGRLQRSQPPLPPLKAFQVLKTLALVAGAAEVKLFYVLIVAQFGGRAVEHHLALFHDVAVASHRERGARVLLHQKDGDAEVAVDVADDGKDFLDQQWR